MAVEANGARRTISSFRELTDKTLNLASR